MQQDDDRLEDLELDADEADRIVGGAPAKVPPPPTPPGVPIPYPNSTDER